MMKIFVLLLALFGAALSMREQSIAVSGKLMCADKPAAKVRVKLWEEEEGNEADNLLDQGYTDSDGRFQLQGGTTQLTPIDPVLKVYHDCHDFMPGSRKVKIGIPKTYITNGKVPTSTFDIGSVNLESVFYEEAREMIVSRKRRMSRPRRAEHAVSNTEKEEKLEEKDGEKTRMLHEKKVEVSVRKTPVVSKESDASFL